MENEKNTKKMPIDVVVEDDRIAVRCCNGEWLVGGIDNRWLWVLGAIAFPDEHTISITDVRKNREDHQKDMSTKEA